MVMHEIIEEMMSRDTHKVLRSSCKIIEFGQNSQKIKEIIPFLDEIKEKTKGLVMGGGLAPNQRFVNFAIRIIVFHENSKACSCNLYTEHSIDPEREIHNGYIEQLKRIAGDWEVNYVVECNKCGQKYNVLRNDGGHMPWFKWTKK